MPKTPPEEFDDNDHTDELPVLIETVVLEPGHVSVVDAEALEDTAERTARFSPIPAVTEVEVESLQSDLAARGAQIAALEEDIAQLNTRWLDVERHLTAKDARIDELSHIVAELRGALAERHTAEQRLAAELRERSAALDRSSSENAELRATAAATERQLAALANQPVAPRVTDEATSVQRLREEVASLATYLENRHRWWTELKAQAAASSADIDRLQRELRSLEATRREATALAARESERATTLRRELVEQTRLAEELRRALAAARAAAAETRAQPVPQAPTRVASKPSPPAQVATSGESRAERGARHPTSADTAEPAAKAMGLPPAPAFEVVAALEAEVGHRRQQIAAQLVELRDREQRIQRGAVGLEQVRQELAAARIDLEHHRADRARLERALVDKDRALEARDARIGSLQDELSERLGAIQKLNAMDLSLQGLDSKMSDRLRRADQTAETAGSPMLVCLTGDAPKQFALTSKTVTIGRGHACDIQIITHFVSREHARITTDRGTIVIEDLASTNGVFVNSIRVERQELQHGDLVTIGETQFRFLESVAH
jgi:predicted RNase H-like nuclease (RuvC/YqgF family)